MEEVLLNSYDLLLDSKVDVHTCDSINSDPSL